MDAIFLELTSTQNRLSANNLLDSAGNGTHPQIILDEVSFVLRGLGKLVLHPLSAMHINLPLRRSESRAELNLHAQESRTSSSSFQNVKLQSILSSERAHLFLLYRNMCELLATRYTPSRPQASPLRSFLSITPVYSNIRNVDGRVLEVRELLRALLMLVGTELGL